LQQAHDTMCKAEARMASATLALKELEDRREAFDFEQQSDEELDRLVQQVDLAEEELEQGATPKVHNFCHACIFCSKLHKNCSHIRSACEFTAPQHVQQRKALWACKICGQTKWTRSTPWMACWGR
jgi:hypothetical protein